MGARSRDRRRIAAGGLVRRWGPSPSGVYAHGDADGHANRVAYGHADRDTNADTNTRAKRVNGSGTGNRHARASVPAASVFCEAITEAPVPIPQIEGARSN